MGEGMSGICGKASLSREKTSLNWERTRLTRPRTRMFTGKSPSSAGDWPRLGTKRRHLREVGLVSGRNILIYGKIALESSPISQCRGLLRLSAEIYRHRGRFPACLLRGQRSSAVDQGCV